MATSTTGSTRIIAPGWMLKQWFASLAYEDQQDFIEKTDLSKDEIDGGLLRIDDKVAVNLSKYFGEDEAELWFWMQLNFDESHDTGQESNKDKLPALSFG